MYRAKGVETKHRERRGQKRKETVEINVAQKIEKYYTIKVFRKVYKEMLVLNSVNYTKWRLSSFLSSTLTKSQFFKVRKYCFFKEKELKEY